jgi:pimeloyl-ACP methyl ester carboxylesterase
MRDALALVLPGLDGWAALRQAFVDQLRWRELDAEAVDYPPSEPMDYAAVHNLLAQRHQAHGAPLILVAESYSGPAAIAFSAERPDAVAALVLVSTFAASPVPSFVRWGARASVFRRRPPEWALRHALVGLDASAECLRDHTEALQRMDPGVVAARVRQALSADARHDLNRLGVPALALMSRHDRILRESRALAGHPRIEVRTVDGPHALLACRPEACAAAVRAFLAGHGNDQAVSAGPHGR